VLSRRGLFRKASRTERLSGSRRRALVRAWLACACPRRAGGGRRALQHQDHALPGDLHLPVPIHGIQRAGGRPAHNVLSSAADVTQALAGVLPLLTRERGAIMTLSHVKSWPSQRELQWIGPSPRDGSKPRGAWPGWTVPVPPGPNTMEDAKISICFRSTGGGRLL